MKDSYTFEKIVNWTSKNSAVCPKNVRVPASRKEVKKALKRVKAVARRTYVPLTRKVTLTLQLPLKNDDFSQLSYSLTSDFTRRYTFARRTHVPFTRKVTLTLQLPLKNGDFSQLSYSLLTLREGTCKFLGQTALFLLIQFTVFSKVQLSFVNFLKTLLSAFSLTWFPLYCFSRL